LLRGVPAYLVTGGGVLAALALLFLVSFCLRPLAVFLGLLSPMRFLRAAF